ncbi:MAG: hypothetical protein NT091_00155 [Candidatus Falkowbacteria bacterium]|nr:hypothetical protein [Candidatus Falkowbacteria bacterium]
MADNIEKRIQELSKRDNVDRRAIANYWARLKIAKDDDADKKEALDGLLEEINYELAQSDKEKKMEIVEKDGIEMHAYPHSLIEAALDTIAPINPEHEQLKNVLEKAREEYFYHYKNKLIEELDARKLGRLKLKLGIGAGFAEDAQLGSKNVGKDITLENLKQEYNKARIAFAKDLKGGGMGDNEIYKLIVLSEQEQLNNIRISIINSKKSNPDKAGFWTKTFEQWSSMKPAQKIAFSVLMVGGGAALGTIAAPIVAYMAGGSTAAFAAIGVSSADVASFIGLSAVTGLGKKLLAGTLAGGIFASVLNPLTSHFEKRSIAKHEKEMTAIASEFNVDNFEVIIARYQASQKNINSTKGRLLVGKAVAMVGVGAVASYNLSIEWNHLFGEAVNVPATGEASAPVEGAVASGGETPLVGSQSVVSAEATPVAEVAALPAEAPVANIHTVEKGDTLWKVIHDHIPGASNTEIANIVNQIETQGPKDFGVDSGEVDWIYPGDEIDLDKIDRLYGGLEHSGTGSVARDVNHASTSHVESQPETYLTHNPETHQIEDVRAQLIGMGDLSNVSARSVEQIRFFANHQNLLSYENLTSEILLISNENSALSLQTIYDHLSLVESFRGFDGCEAYQTMLVNIAENSKNIDIEKFHQLFGENAIYPPTLETTATSKMVLVIDFNEQNANGVRYVGEQVKINLSSGQTDFRTSANHLGGFGANPTLTSDSALNRFSFKEALDQIKK